MAKKEAQKVAVVTGSAGFIGFHVARKLLVNGWRVVGVDCLSDYYDVQLKRDREAILIEFENYRSIHENIGKPGFLTDLFLDENPNIVIHLAAQAGVRNSLNNPRSYVESNIVGSFELLEAARVRAPEHLLIASTSSVYGANDKVPFMETDRSDYQVSLYAATKKSTENLAHSYSHLFNIPMTVFRFFTVYGPWGRPDMALFKFTRSIIANEAIDLYNHGDMKRDFTYVGDLVDAVSKLIELPPDLWTDHEKSQSPAAPYRVVNIGNSKPVALLDFVSELESILGLKAERNLLPMQMGDVHMTYADQAQLRDLIGDHENTSLRQGIEKFVKWYHEYYPI